jgi:hypothetical protein
MPTKYPGRRERTEWRETAQCDGAMRATLLSQPIMPCLGPRGGLLWVALVTVLAAVYTVCSDVHFYRATMGIVRGPADTVTATSSVVAKTTRDKSVTVVDIEGRSGMAQLLSRYNKESNLFCEMIDAHRSEDPNVFLRFNITFGCQELFDKAGCGTGNFLQMFYGMRLAAEVYGDVELHFTCHDAEETRNHLVFPWLTGFYPARSRRNVPSAFPDVTPHDVCLGANLQPVGHMGKKMQQDFRYMAYSLVGRSLFEQAKREANGKEEEEEDFYVPSFVPQLSPPTTPPPYANVELDEAVIHFRCGDLMDSDHRSFTFLTFRGYTRHIAPDVRTIGILTQPLTEDASWQVRRIDAAPRVRDRCRIVVDSLVHYIEERFPQAVVHIHDTDRIALTYARIVLASQQVVVGLSTFGALPAVATFGTAYLRVPDQPNEVNQWLIRPPMDDILPHVVLTDDPKMPVQRMQALWEQEGERGVLAWFWNDTWTAEEEDA